MSERGNKKTMIGLVASDKMNKTVVVEVTRRTIHPMYHKYINRRKRYQAHDEANDCQVGDRVLIEECRPMSARKHWRIKQVLERAV
jgi:small subunit ribosomal protein S17